MQGAALDQSAMRRRVERKLRSDCVSYGVPADVVAVLPLERLLIERRRAVRRLMQAPERGT